MKESKVQSAGTDNVTKMRNAMLLSFMLGRSFSFLQEFKISFEIQKIQKIVELTHPATKICQFPQFGIFGDISCSRQSQINLLIYLLFYVDNCRLSTLCKCQSLTLIFRMTNFQVLSTSRKQTHVRDLSKAGTSFIRPLSKSRPYASFESKTVLVQVFPLYVLYLTVLLQRAGEKMSQTFKQPNVI